MNDGVWGSLACMPHVAVSGGSVLWWSVQREPYLFGVDV